MTHFDNLDIDNFMGFVINESTITQIKEALNTKGISFGEYPSYFDKNSKDIRFTYRIGYVDWTCMLSVKNDVLKSVMLNNYSPDSHNTFRILCRELIDRYGSFYNVRSSQNSREGTETMCFEDKEDAFHFTEVVYDSSPIIGQKNIYINYFKASSRF